MNCSQCREQLAAHLEGLLDRDETSPFESHLAECPQCRKELDELKQLVGQLADQASGVSTDSLDTRVMDRILGEQALQIRRLRMRRRVRLFAMGGTAAAIAVLFVLAVFWPWRPDNTVQAAEVLAKAAEAALDLRGVHIRGRVRTAAQVEFGAVSPDAGFVPVEVWRQFGDEPKWRIEKPKRVAVMDGASTVMLINSEIAFKAPPHSPLDGGWLLRMADVGDVITEELRVGLAQGGDLNLAARREGRDGKQKLVVTIDATAPKDVAEHVKKGWITLSDHRRVYQFDARTRRLEDVKIYMRRHDRDVLVFEATEIEYNPSIDPSTFVLEIPESALWYQEPRKLPDNEEYEQMSPDEVARALFEACAKEDWEEAEKHWIAPITESMKKHLAGLEIVRIGEPVKSERGSNWWVPYEIKLSTGHVKKLRLNLRKSPSAGRYIAVGGI